jgi:hypothetical protein
MKVTKDDILVPDKAAGFQLLPTFQRFNQKDDIFRRSWWVSLRSTQPTSRRRSMPGNLIVPAVPGSHRAPRPVLHSW